MESLKKSFQGNDEAWENFVWAYQLQMRGEFKEALQFYERSIKLYPTAEAMTFFGWTLSFQGRLEEAIDACKRAIDIDEDFGNPYNDIGAYLIQLGRHAEALPWLTKAIRAKRYDSPQFPYANLGTVYEALDQPRKALTNYKRAIQIEPNYTYAIRHLIGILGQLN